MYQKKKKKLPIYIKKKRSGFFPIIKFTSAQQFFFIIRSSKLKINQAKERSFSFSSLKLIILNYSIINEKADVLLLVQHYIGISNRGRGRGGVVI